jgi:hypothetical protein
MVEVVLSKDSRSTKFVFTTQKIKGNALKNYLHLRSGKYSIMDDDLLPIKYWECVRIH